jgi:hypothetical protein
MDLQKLERARLAIGITAAVVTGGAALYGVHWKAREATAASYETLAPEVNDLKDAVRALQEENAVLRSALLARAASAGAGAGAPATQGRAAPRRPRPRAAPAQDGGAPAPEPGGAPASPEGAPPARPAPPEVEEVLEKVPIDFEKAAEIWRDVKELRRKREQRR